ncbi:MAG: hypothetical protein AAB581_03690 [Patescibacteria group bacterium]|mgnify:CR=1 FL=1
MKIKTTFLIFSVFFIFFAGCRSTLDLTLYVSKSVVYPREQVEITSYVHQEKSPVTYRWEISPVGCGVISCPTCSRVWWRAPIYTGTCAIGLTAIDGDGDDAYEAVLISVVPVAGNFPPVAGDIVASASSGAVLPGETVSLYVDAYDPEGGPLKYKWSATCGRVQGSDSGAAWNAPLTHGTSCVVTVTVSDVPGAASGDSKTFTVL